MLWFMLFKTMRRESKEGLSVESGSDDVSFCMGEYPVLAGRCVAEGWLPQGYYLFELHFFSYS